MADFLPAFKLVRKHEGNYVNHYLDRGGETYAGIARKFWPTWQGWAAIDKLKASGATLVANQLITEAEPFVQLFYNQLWNGHRFDLIQNQSIANLLFDWLVNSGTLAIRKTQEVLNAKFGGDGLLVDGNIGPKTALVINAAKADKLYAALWNERKGFYERIVERKPNQVAFLRGWMNRLNSYQYVAN